MVETGSESQDLYIVALGASAGGLEALERFFKHMPPTTHMAFLIVQHLSPDYKSHMVELLSKFTTMPVHEAQDGLRVEGGHIYLLPPKKNMTIFKGVLYLVDYDRTHGLNLPIDLLFDSLAKDFENRAIACILSGTGSDGTKGIRSIKEHGGSVIVQDKTARFDGMPRSAIATNLTDYTLPPEEMPEILARLTNPVYTYLRSDNQPTGQNVDFMAKILAILRDRNNVDFSGYKHNTLIRRIERRLTLLDINSLENYVLYLNKSNEERQQLVKEFLISVTSFFRDNEVFEILQSQIIPDLLASSADSGKREPIRVWVPGCATGEEAYSLAMLFQNHMEQTGQFNTVKIFATDIDREALERAGSGRFSKSIEVDVPENLLHQYFNQIDTGYEISRQIRSMVVFAFQNALSDPPFSNIDLISCRNLLIYLQPTSQQRLLSTFQFSLRNNGYLLLGNSESVSERFSDFMPLHTKAKIYRYVGQYNPLENTVMNTSQPLSVARARPSMISKGVSEQNSGDPVLRSLVEQLLPPCIVVKEDMTMVHGFGDLTPYMIVPRGYKVSLNVLKLVRDELAIPLGAAMQRTLKTGTETTFESITLHHENETLYIRLSTRFFRTPSSERLVLITFVPYHEDHLPEEGKTFEINDSIGQHIQMLEQELQYTRENLQSTIEELETSNEELQATNEELMAANEELQSTNEELESVNEELLTVNNEYQMKIRELTALNDDVNNLLKSIDIGTIFLDGRLNIRKFTPPAQSAISLMDHDVGRPIQHFTHKLVNFDLIGSIQSVLDSLIPRDYEVESQSGAWYLLRILPYRTHSNQINGVVLTLVDITEIKRVSQAAQEQHLFSQVILNSLSAHIAVLSKDGTIVNVNESWRQFSRENGGTPTVTDVGTNYLEVCRAAAPHNEDAARCYEGLFAVIEGRLPYFEMDYPCHSPTEKRWFSMRVMPLNTRDNSVVVSHINITERMMIEQALGQSQRRLQLAMRDMPLALFEQNLLGQYTWLFNHASPFPTEDALGYTDAQILNSPTGKTLQEIKLETIEKNQVVYRNIMLYLRHEQYSCDVMVEPIHDDTHQVIGVIGSYSNFQLIERQNP